MLWLVLEGRWKMFGLPLSPLHMRVAAGGISAAAGCGSVHTGPETCSYPKHSFAH